MNNEPNFEGEEMKLPEEAVNQDSERTLDSHQGTYIFVMIVALIIILAGLIYWYQTTRVGTTEINTTSTRPSLEVNKEPETTTAAAQVESLTAVSTSDEIAAIEADLESTDLNNLEAELTQIEAELAAE